METANNIQISIPKPCHEDWNKMTPNEKGAFCMKCAKTVVDFTRKTTEEIQQYLTEKRGQKICGRFMNDQLQDAPKPVNLLIPVHLLPKKLSFGKAFLYAVFIAFGTTLFSCSTQQGEIVGKIAPVTDTPKVQTPPAPERLMGDTVILDHSAAPVKTKTSCNTLKGDVMIEPVKQGEIAVIPDTVIKKDTIDQSMMLGKVKISN